MIKENVIVYECFIMILRKNPSLLRWWQKRKTEKNPCNANSCEITPIRAGDGNSHFYFYPAVQLGKQHQIPLTPKISLIVLIQYY